MQTFNKCQPIPPHSWTLSGCHFGATTVRCCLWGSVPLWMELVQCSMLAWKTIVDEKEMLI